MNICLKKTKGMTFRFRVIFFSFIFLCSSFFFSPISVQAGYWGEPTAANLMLFNLEQIAEEIKGVVLSIVKNAALQTINQQVLGLVNGSWGQGSLIIEDWEDFIFTQSGKNASDVVLNDFFPNVLSGKGSGGNFIASSEGVDPLSNLSSTIKTIGNYPEYLSKIGKDTLKDLESDIPKFSLDKICPDPSDALSKGDFACFSKIMEPQNNPHGFQLITEQKYSEEKTKNEQIATTQAGITGYKPQKNESGLVVTPPQTIADIVSTIQTLPAMAIAVAENPAELATAVIQTYVNSLIQKTLSKVGLGPIGANFAENLGNELSRETDGLIEDGIGEFFGADGLGTDIIGPNNVGSISSPAPNLNSSSSGPNWQYID